MHEANADFQLHKVNHVQLILKAGPGENNHINLTNDTNNYKESSESKKATYNVEVGGWAGWYNGNIVKNYRSYVNNGYLKFWVKTQHDIEISIRSENIPTGTEKSKIMINAEYGIPFDNNWHEVTIVLSDFYNKDRNLDFSQIKVYFCAAIVSWKVGAANGVFWIDGVRWVKI